MGNDRTTRIFSTDTGIIALDSPVKLKILELLGRGVTAFDDLVEQSGKAKSTISVHLDDLEELSLIQEKKYSEDKRKKYFVLNSLCIAFSGTPLRSQYNKHLDDIAVSGLNEGSFVTHLFRTIRYGMEAYGVDPKPIMRKLGNDVGRKIGPGFKSNDIDGLLNELSSFWKNNQLGDMDINGHSKPAIVISNCYHCCKMPNVGKTLCSMDEGLLEGIFSSRLKRDYQVREIECYGTGHNHCKFVVKER